MLKDAFSALKAIIVFIAICFCSCSKKTYVYETKQSENNIHSDAKDFFVFENDTMKIVYSFWSDGGSMAFSIFNKLDIPLYVNWKRSSLVLNSQKTDYWAEETVSNIRKVSKTTAVTTYDITSPLYYLMSLSSVSSAAYIQSSTIVPEKITFIAPKSYIFKGKDGLISNQKLQTSLVWKDISIKPTVGTGKSVKVSVVEFDQSTSPIFFRNFLSISTSEGFEHEQYIDHRFYVTRIIKVKTADAFKNLYNKEKKRYVNTYFFYHPTHFYQNGVK